MSEGWDGSSPGKTRKKRKIQMTLMLNKQKLSPGPGRSRWMWFIGSPLCSLLQAVRAGKRKAVCFQGWLRLQASFKRDAGRYFDSQLRQVVNPSRRPLEGRVA